MPVAGGAATGPFIIELEIPVKDDLPAIAAIDVERAGDPSRINPAP
jgi:hypothetical protein